MKTAKVTDVIQIREWKRSPDADPIYYHTIALDNGDKGSVGKKTKGAIKEGDSLNYTIDGDKIKEVMQNGFNGNGYKGAPRASAGSLALSYSKDLMCSMVAAGKTNGTKASDIADATLIVAAKFKTWLKENEK